MIFDEEQKYIVDTFLSHKGCLELSFAVNWDTNIAKMSNSNAKYMILKQ